MLSRDPAKNLTVSGMICLKYEKIDCNKGEFAFLDSPVVKVASLNLIERLTFITLTYLFRVIFWGMRCLNLALKGLNLKK